VVVGRLGVDFDKNKSHGSSDFLAAFAGTAANMKLFYAAVTLATAGCLVDALPATKWKRQTAGDAFAVLDPQNWVNPDNVSYTSNI
jgi:hypothetical protein